MKIMQEHRLPNSILRRERLLKLTFHAMIMRKYHRRDPNESFDWVSYYMRMELTCYPIVV